MHRRGAESTKEEGTMKKTQKGRSWWQRQRAKKERWKVMKGPQAKGKKKYQSRTRCPVEFEILQRPLSLPEAWSTVTHSWARRKDSEFKYNTKTKPEKYSNGSPLIWTFIFWGLFKHRGSPAYFMIRIHQHRMSGMQEHATLLYLT